jgi:hypothetical protein
MPRFFFDTAIGETEAHDDAGIEYGDSAAAIRDARRSLPELVAEAVRTGASECGVTVRDASGTMLTRIFATLGEEDASGWNALSALQHGDDTRRKPAKGTLR